MGRTRPAFRSSIRAEFLYRFLVVLPFPFQGGGQNLIKRNSRVLSVPMGIIVQLRLALR